MCNQLLVIMKMKVLLCLLSLLALLASQRIPKPAILDINDLYSSDIARDGKEKFWKVDGNYWSTIISSNPVPNDTITKVKIYLQIGATFMIGCGKKDTQRMRDQYVGQIPNTVSYYTENGRKYKAGDPVEYAQKSMQGDTVTMIIDLREHQKLVRFQKNDRPLGIAYSGLQDWENIYIMFSVHWVNHKFKILEYSIQE